MAKITADNPFEKGTKQYRMFNALKTGKEVTADTLREAAQEPLSNRTMGVFIRDLEGKGFRFNRRKSAEDGIVYTMLHGDNAKGVAKISVAPGSYKDNVSATAAKKPAAKKAPAKAAAPAKKTTAKKPASAPQKPAAASKPAKATKTATKATKAPQKPVEAPKKKGISRKDGEEAAVTNAPKGKVKLSLKSKAA